MHEKPAENTRRNRFGNKFAKITKNGGKVAKTTRILVIGITLFLVFSLGYQLVNEYKEVGHHQFFGEMYQ